MMLVSKKTALEITSSMFVNLTSGWFGVVLIVPGVFSVSSVGEYFKLLTINVPFGIVGLIIAMYLLERSKSL